MGANAGPPSSAPSRGHSAQTRKILALRAETDLSPGLGGSLAPCVPSRRRGHCCRGFEPRAPVRLSGYILAPLQFSFCSQCLPLPLFLPQSRYCLSAPRWLRRTTRGVSRSGGRTLYVLLCMISCRAALAPPVPAFLRFSTSLNCTSAPQLSLQCLAARGKARPSNEKRL